MNFMRDHYDPPPASRVILAYTVRPNDTVLFEDGTQLAVTKAAFGDPIKLGFVELNGRVAAPWVFEFSNGRGVTTHPRTPVRIKGLGVLASH